MGLLQKIKENKMGEFNEAQVAAIKHKKGPMLVLAGAGSGKTTVLTYRIKNLIMNREVNPKNILVLTFTKAAAKEMEERFHGMMPKRNQVTFGTFHSVFLRILVKHGGYSYKNIVSPRVQTDIIQRAATELDHYLGSGFQECMDKTKEIILNIELIKNHRIKDVKEISEKELELKNMSADTAWILLICYFLLIISLKRNRMFWIITGIYIGILWLTNIRILIQSKMILSCYWQNQGIICSV